MTATLHAPNSNMNRLTINLITALLCTALVITPSKNLKAQISVTEAIKLVVKKVIKAIDLQVQRLQNVTIELQNAQKKVENTLSKLKLKEIADWTQKQKDLYEQYFDELWRVKSILAYYHRTTSIVDLQKQLFREYKDAYRMVQSSTYFTSTEKEFMVGVYDGMLNNSLTGVGDLIGMMKSFAVQMSDAERLSLIDKTNAYLQELLSDLRSFNNQNIGLSQLRSRNRNDMESLRRIIGK